MVTANAVVAVPKCSRTELVARMLTLLEKTVNHPPFPVPSKRGFLMRDFYRFPTKVYTPFGRPFSIFYEPIDIV